MKVQRFKYVAILWDDTFTDHNADPEELGETWHRLSVGVVVKETKDKIWISAELYFEPPPVKVLRRTMCIAKSLIIYQRTLR